MPDLVCKSIRIENFYYKFYNAFFEPIIWLQKYILLKIFEIYYYYYYNYYISHFLDFG